MAKIPIRKRSTIAATLAFCALSASAELTQAMTDPMANAATADPMPVDSMTLMRSQFAKELDTGAPHMSDPSDDTWWRQFNDSMLDWLIAKASESNLNLLSAIHNIQASRYSLMAVKSGYYPTLSASAMYQGGQSSGATMKGNPTSPVMENFIGLSLELNWEIDVFGRVRKQYEATGASYNATRAEYVATLNSLCAQVASVYFDLSAARLLYSTALSHLESQQEILRITEVRLETGLSSKLDYTQQLTVVLDTKSALPTLQSRMESDINQLSLLTNICREEIKEKVVTGPLPDISADMAHAIGPELIRRRPDVAEAEYNLAAACAKAGLAKKDWLPTLSLSASVATESHAARNLFSGRSITYSVTPTIAWTIFDGFEREYSIAEAKAAVLAAADTYDYTVASALNEVATATTDYLCLLEEIDLLDQCADTSKESLALSIELYKSGLNSFTDVANAQVSWLSYENSAISAKYNALSALTTLYRALGGGWNGQLPEPANK